MTLPSFFAASISACVTASAGGAAASTRVANAAPPSATVPCSNLRRDRLGILVSLKRFFFAPRFIPAFLSYQHAAPLRRQGEPDLIALRHALLRGRNHPQLRAIRKLD